MLSYHQSSKANQKEKSDRKIIEQATSRLTVADTAESTLQYLSLWPDSKGHDAGDISPQPLPVSPSMILLTLQMRSVMMRPIASQGLLGPLATVEATMGARERTMTAPSNTWENTCTHARTYARTHKHTPGYCYVWSLHWGHTEVWHWGNDIAVKGAPERLIETNRTFGSLPLLCSLCNPIFPTPQSWTPSVTERGTEMETENRLQTGWNGRKQGQFKWSTEWDYMIEAEDAG